MKLIDCLGNEVKPGEFLLRSTPYGYFIKRFDSVIKNGVYIKVSYIRAQHLTATQGIFSAYIGNHRLKVDKILKYTPSQDFIDLWDKTYLDLQATPDKTMKYLNILSSDQKRYEALYRLPWAYVE